MSATIAFDAGNDHLNARMYAGLSTASELAASLTKGRSGIPSLLYEWRLHWLLQRLNRELKETLGNIEADVERKREASLSSSAAAARYIPLRDSILRSHETYARLLSDKDRWPKGLRRDLDRFHDYTERLLDLADWLDALSTPEETSAKFEAALQELARGEVVPLSSLQ
jgi:hypothetical protein